MRARIRRARPNRPQLAPFSSIRGERANRREFGAAYNRPVATEAPIELDAEYRQLREEAAFVRRPTIRVVEVRGADAVDFLESQLTNDVAPLAPGEAYHAALLDRKGHLQSDMRVHLIDPDRVWL